MNNFQYIKDLGIITGEANGFYFILQYSRRKQVAVLQFNVGDETDGGILDFIDDYREDHPGIGSLVEFNRIKPQFLIPVSLKKIDMEHEFPMIVEAISFELMDRGYVQRCSISGNTQDLGIYRIGKTVDILNRDIYRLELLDRENTYNNEEKSSIKAYGGAFIGMLLGVAIWVGVMQLRIMAGFIGFLIITFGFQGYERFGGKLARKSMLTILVGSVLMIFVAEYVSRAIDVYRAFGGAYGFFTVLTDVLPAYIQEGTMARAMAGNIAIGIGLTVLSSWGRIKEKMNEVNKPLVTYPILEANPINEPICEDS
ncbi:hypothetical protein G7062_01495 [Erysipelothrix sp. HDW6C]|uniref:hypothetical protein n=1 Tax=Erysipelothrix sp. HDW6C TaxID=2714930 RepID=UPI00140E5B75|nr:hypothetical protein [Erysipelothrix sp. HDW6C]QIK69035.1 hypothetical protein G7062_01495 [Erysipelothrix sp. HDW6C]